MEEENQELVINVSSVEKGLGGSVTEKLELTIDQVVEEYVGSFGFSQLVHVFLVSLAWIFESQSTLVTIFADAQPDSWRCIGSSSSCAVGGIRSTGRAAAVCGLKPGSWQWVDGHESSTIAEWGLVCDRKFLAVIPASLYFIGSLIGSAIFGRLADAFLGRKGALLISCLLTSATNFLTSLSPNIWIYALLRFANGFSRSGIGICCLVLSTEVVGCHWRGQVGQYGFFFFTTGFLSLPIIAYPTRMHWRNLYRIISLLPVVYSIFILAPFVLESPRWLLGRGRSKEALYVLEKYARFNGKKLPVDHICLSQPSRTAESSTKIGEIIRETSPRTLWNTSWAVKRMVLLMIVGSGIGFVYYGIQLNVENLNFNLYFTVAMNALMEIPAVFIGSVLLGMANRRLILSGSAYIAGISSILCIIFSRSFSRENDDNNSGGSGAQMILEGIGLMAASTAFGVLYRSTGPTAAAVCGLKLGSWQWVSDHESSTIAEWDLVCDRKFLAAIPASLYFLGSLIGSTVFSRLADAFLGRKRALLIACLLTSATNFLTSFSTNIWIFALLRFANGFSRSRIGICCLVLSTEVVGCHWRGQVGQYGFFFFTAGFLSLPMIAYPTRMHWRNLYRIISLLPVVYSIFILVPFVLESPRWLLGRGRSKEALYVLEKYARFNGKKLPVDHLCLSQPSRTAGSSTKIGEIIRETSPRRTLWNTSWAIKRMALLMIAGFGIGFVYYGTQLNVENLNSNLYYAVIMNALMGIPAVFIGGLLLGLANRQLILSSSAYIAGISSILCILFLQ